MLGLLRRHLKTCPHTSLSYRRCKCPVHVYGTLNGKRIRKSLDTTSWERADEIMRGLDPDETPEKIWMKAASERFLANCKSRKVAKETLGKYELLYRELNDRFLGREVNGISADQVGRYRESWNCRR